MTTIRWGVLSTARIGLHKVVPAIQATDGCEVVAIASRDRGRADAAAEQLGIATAYGSYEELLEAPEVDVVYLPLPNDLHAPWVLRAAAAGKHVLCEKPLAMDAAEAETMAAACEDAGVVLAEAFMYRHHPTWVEALRLVRTGAIGQLQAVQSFFSYHDDDPDDIRNQLARGGGALRDVGCYCINLSRLLFDAEPERVDAVVARDPVLGIDTTTSALLSFPGGGQSTFTCSTRAEPDQRVHIVGTTGRIDIEIPFNIPPDRETRLTLTAGGDPPTDPARRTIAFPPSDVHAEQARLVARAVADRTGAPVPVADAIANQRVIDAILGA